MVSLHKTSMENREHERKKTEELKSDPYEML